LSVFPTHAHLLFDQATDSIAETASWPQDDTGDMCSEREIERKGVYFGCKYVVQQCIVSVFFKETTFLEAGFGNNLDASLGTTSKQAVLLLASLARVLGFFCFPEEVRRTSPSWGQWTSEAALFRHLRMRNKRMKLPCPHQ
jgi:hypothetical protein